MKKTLTVASIVVLLIILSSCSAQQPMNQALTPLVVLIEEQIPSQISIPLITPSATAEGSMPLIITTTLIKNGNNSFPDLWTGSGQEKIEIFPLGYLDDYAYAKDGSMWMTGGFGVIHQMKDGRQDWYSIKNGLGTNVITSLEISPIGEVWVGGQDNTLYRFDGKEWVDEGIKIPPPADPRKQYTCYSTDIHGIDFDENGNVWVMNAGIELYTKAMGFWVNFPFPKEFLSMAGGGGCPIGLRVISYKDITIKRNGCCMSKPVGYHYDGNKWVEGSDYSIVDKVYGQRHQPHQTIFDGGYIPRNGDTTWPFSTGSLFPYSWNDRLGLFLDKSGSVWITDFKHPYKIANGEFLDEPVGENKFTLPDYRNPRPTSGLEDKDWLKKFFTMYWNKYLLSNYDEWGSLSYVSNEKALVSAKGSIWVVEKDKWQEMDTGEKDQVYKYMVEDDKGTIYAATDTGIVEIDGETMTYQFLEYQDAWPLIWSNKITNGCTYNRRYLPLECYQYHDDGPKVHFTTLALSSQKDGSIVYVNNRIIAKRENGEWKSLFFDTLEFSSAVVDPEGNVWVTAGANGLIKFPPEIFDNYREE